VRNRAEAAGSDEPAATAERFLAAFSEADFEAMREVLAPDLRAFVTNAEGGTDEVRGRARQDPP
jgi:limonene-1,2-epoxide hydrolase